MIAVSTYDAKATLSALIDQAEHGEEVFITRHGKPVAKLVPITPPAWKPFSALIPPRRHGGGWVRREDEDFM